MAGDSTLLNELEAFVESTIDLGPLEATGDALRVKLDVLGRIVELLRLRAGWNMDRVRIGDLLNAGISIEHDLFDNAAIRLGAGDKKAMWDWPVIWERKEIELQAALLVYLLYYQHAGTRIGDLLVGFVNLIRDQLAPADAETTETGVTRIITTTRTAARTLRYWGLLTDSTRVAYKTWELSVLGILVAIRLRERGQGLDLPPRHPHLHFRGPSGASYLLASPVMNVVRELADPNIVAGMLYRICMPNVEVFDSFGPVIDAVSEFCERVERIGVPERSYISQLRQEAEAMMKAVAAAVPPGKLADDVAKHFAIEELLG